MNNNSFQKHVRYKNPIFNLGTHVEYDEKKLPSSKKRVESGTVLTRVIMDKKTGKPIKTGKLSLTSKIGGKGEGTVYKCSIQNKVCKIYHPDKITEFRLRKLLEMQKNKIKIGGVCWPEELLYHDKNFVGYLMREAGGYELQTSVMNPMVIQDKFPSWQRKELVSLCLSVIRISKELHNSNIIIGDLNATNILVKDFNNIYFIDCDSFQIGNYPCPVGTPYFTPREIQSKKYSEFLRNKEHDMFALTTLVFMILFMGKPPYSCKGGGTPAENIRNGNFPYKFNERKGEDAPEGPWKFIWNNLPRRMKEIFEACFANNKRPSIGDLERVLFAYRSNIEKGYNTNDLLPTENKFVSREILDKYKK